MKAVCCGSFDPITKGHEDIVRRAAAIFDEVVVLIGKNPEKTYFFSEETRRAFCEKTFADLPNVRVDVWDGIVVEYAKTIGAKVLVKGIRNLSDFLFFFIFCFISVDFFFVCKRLYTKRKRLLPRFAGSHS